MKQMLLIDARTLDPDHNLALEEYVFSHMPRDKEYLILWQNDNAVIIGRHQNTLAEIDAQYVKAHNIHIHCGFSHCVKCGHCYHRGNAMYVNEILKEDAKAYAEWKNAA